MTASKPVRAAAALGLLLAIVLLVPYFVDPPPAATPGAQLPKTESAATPAPYVADPERFLRAAHWFGSGWAVNLWNTDLEAQVDVDFRRLAEDGFNTVVLVVPWTGFAPDARSGRLDAERVQRLRGLIRIAARHGLGVIVRVSYAWDSLAQDSGQRLLALWTEDEVHRAWLDHLASLWLAIGEEPNLLFGFFSWEDLWAVMSLADADEPTRQAAAERTGFRDWLRGQHSLEAVGERFRLSFEDWESVPIPSRHEPAYKLFLEFIDFAWLQRFFLPAQKLFPRLSMEIRIDSDPVRDGDALIEWHSHEAAWDLPGADWTTIYWSPAMGGKNRGELLEPDVAAQRLEESLRRILDRTGARPIFIGQFLAEDFTPGYEHNGRVPRERVGEFLDLAAQPLGSLAAGYGLWAWRDYRHDAIANPEFVSGLEGWTLEGGGGVTEEGLYLPVGASLGTDVSVHAYHAPGGPASAQLCVLGSALGSREGRLDIQEQLVGTALGHLPMLPGEPVERCLDMAVSAQMRLQFKPDVDVRLRRVSSSGFVQHSGMRGPDAEPKPIAASYRKLNARLDRAVRPEVPAYQDGWIGRSLVLQLERLPAANELRFQTHLPAGWPVRPRLSVAVDGERIGEVECVEGGQVAIPLPQHGSRGDALLRVDSSATHRPAGDERDLGCVLSGLELGTSAPSKPPVE